MIQTLLWELLTWMSLAKLQKHTLYTLGELDASTTRLGSFLRQFAQKTADGYDTRDLPTELAKKARDKARRDAKSSRGVVAPAPNSGAGAKKRVFNMNTPKIHGLGHVKPSIIRTGCADGTSTMVVSIEWYLLSAT